MTQWFFTKVHLLNGKLVPLWRFTHLKVHTLIGITRLIRNRVTQDEDHTRYEQSTRVPFGSPSRKGQEPLTITTIGAGDKHLPPLDNPRYTKLSRWRQSPRVTSEIYSETQYPSASRCNHSNQCTWMLSILTK
jgi:hypothetical protein